MKTLLMVGAVVLFGMGGVASADKAKKGSTVKTEDCGAMMKQLSALPTKFAELMNNVAGGMAAHADWVGMNKDAASQAESAAMKKIAADHKELANQATKTAADMNAALAPAPHDMSKMDPKAAEGMAQGAKLEREMAALMIKHAEDTEKTLQSMKPASK